MPYTNPEHKKQWESLHRVQRLARRRELRQIAAGREAYQPEESRVEDSAVGFLLLPIAVGVALASYNPKLAIGAAGLTLMAAAALKKNWVWWIVGATTFAIGFFLHLKKQNENK